MALPADLVDQLADAITTRRLGPDDLLFATREGTAISSAPASGCPPYEHPESTSTSASTTSATPTPPGSSPAAQI